MPNLVICLTLLQFPIFRSRDPPTIAVQPLHAMVRHCVGCVAGLHAIVVQQSCFVSFRLYIPQVAAAVAHRPLVAANRISCKQNGARFPAMRTLLQQAFVIVEALLRDTKVHTCFVFIPVILRDFMG